jgi:hypothetical protein
VPPDVNPHYRPLSRPCRRGVEARSYRTPPTKGRIVHIDMPYTVKVKSVDEALRNHREALAQRVISQCGNEVPEGRVLCFFDDVDWQALKDSIGIANRGVYMPIGKGEPAWWQDMPDYLRNAFLLTASAALTI